MLNSSFYRPDIDGLRAIAVSLVILFHADIGPFTGGYVGVDVFFVISGYLITNIIVNDIKRNRFTFRNFYLRRAKRILPALILVIAVCFPLSIILLPPLDAKNFAYGSIAVSTFSANILFWTQSGYFDASSELNPLLHTWSLSVEEQFYIFFPLLLLLVYKKGIQLTLTYVLALSVISLFYSIWASYSSPHSAFYLLPSRCWEIFVGCVICLIQNYLRFYTARWVHQILSIAGFILIIFPALLYDNMTPFPGAYALLPVVGTALILAFSNKATPIYNLLARKPLVIAGLISYSAYLWHQPIFVFARHYLDTNPSTFTKSLLVFLTFLIAFITWKFVEQPIRRSQKNKKIVAYTVVFVGMIVTSGAYFSQNAAVEKIHRSGDILKHTNYDMHDHMIQTSCNYWWRPQTGEFNFNIFSQCENTHGKAVVIFGDSHAMNLYNIYARTERIPFLIGISSGGCRFTDQMYDECSNLFETVRKIFDVYSNSVGTAIYHQAGSQFLGDKNGQADYYDYSKFYGKGYTIRKKEIIKVIANLNYFHAPEKVIWVGPWTEPRSLNFSKFSDISIEAFDRLEGSIKLTLESSSHEFKYVSLNEIFGENLRSFRIGNCHIYKDGNHFSRCGEQHISQQFGDTLVNTLF